MSREPEVSITWLIEELKQRSIFTKEGALKSKSDPIWKQIKADLKLKMAADTLYLYLYSNRHECATKLQKFFKIKTKITKAKHAKRKDNAMLDADFIAETENPNPQNCAELNLEVKIDTDRIVDTVNRRKQEFWSDDFF